MINKNPLSVYEINMLTTYIKAIRNDKNSEIVSILLSKIYEEQILEFYVHNTEEDGEIKRKVTVIWTKSGKETYTF